jgi:CAAX prenyl protease-like protein
MTLDRTVVARIAPFALFMVLLALRGEAPADGSWGFDPRWIYAVTVVAVAALVAWFWRDYGELAAQNRPGSRDIALAVGMGLAVFAAWIHLDAPWMRIGEPVARFVPLDEAGAIDWTLVAWRCAGAALLVPVAEELFWRSFLMRWIEDAQFVRVVPQQVGLKAIVLSTFVFTLAHTLWLAAALAGLVYAWLYRRTGSLWVPIVAHAVTNGALGVWVVMTGRWEFW